MRTAKLLKKLREAIQYAKLETAEFGDVCRLQAHMKYTPVKLADGRIVTEENVTEFIRERVRLHHSTWITYPLEQVAAEMQMDLKHEFERGTGRIWCIHCHCSASHPAHRRGST